MIGEPYPFLSEDYGVDNDVLFFTFLSQGEEVIPKAIAFTPIEKDRNKYYNWGFGDLMIDDDTDGFFIDDKIESNNGDVKSVFYTVVSTLSTFFGIHPEATVYIEGSNRQRTKIYSGLIIRHWRQIEPFYNIMGYSNGKIEPFRSDIVFEYLLISRKKM
jgi:hypothetical protein